MWRLFCHCSSYLSLFFFFFFFDALGSLCFVVMAFLGYLQLYFCMGVIEVLRYLKFRTNSKVFSLIHLTPPTHPLDHLLYKSVNQRGYFEF